MLGIVDMFVWLGGLAYKIFYVAGVYFSTPFGEWTGTYEFFNPVKQTYESVEFVGGAITDIITTLIPPFAGLTILDLVLYLFVSALVLVIVARIIDLFAS